MNTRYPFSNEHQMFPLSYMGTCQESVVPESLSSLALFDGIIETISMAFSRNIFQAYTGIFIFENNVFTF